jgi:hypothetical protein
MGERFAFHADAELDNNRIADDIADDIAKRRCSELRHRSITVAIQPARKFSELKCAGSFDCGFNFWDCAHAHSSASERPFLRITPQEISLLPPFSSPELLRRMP